MKSSLGVLITYFNERELLRECLESILNQTAKQDEILIYDDASKYPAEHYVPKNLPIQIIRGQRNRNPSYGRNVLLRSSKSDYIHFHDADDLFHPDWCQQIRDKIEETKADIIFTEVSSYLGNQLVCERLLGVERLIADKNLIRFCLQNAILPIASTIRRDLAIESGGYPETLRQAEDFYFHARLAVHKTSWAVISKPLVFKRNRSGSHSRDSREVWESALEAVRLLGKEIPSQYRNDLSEFATHTGTMLYELHAHLEAREAFRLAQQLGPPTFQRQRRLYRVVAKAFGPEIAEIVGSVYRNTIPERLRKLISRVQR